MHQITINHDPSYAALYANIHKLCEFITIVLNINLLILITLIIAHQSEYIKHIRHPRCDLYDYERNCILLNIKKNESQLIFEQFQGGFGFILNDKYINLKYLKSFVCSILPLDVYS